MRFAFPPYDAVERKGEAHSAEQSIPVLVQLNIEAQ
jgi:hypothetical protein